MKQGRFSTSDLFQKLRLYSGIILMVYAFTHLLNHSLGVVNLAWMEQGRLVFVGFWRHPLLSWVVPTSLAVHFVLVLYKLYRKNTFKGLQRNEWAQIILGLIIPMGLVPHIIETRISKLYFEIDDTYSFYLGSYYPEYLVDWFVFIVIIWAHGVIGLTFFLKQKRWYPRWRNVLQGIAIALPIFASMGLLSAGKEIQLLKADSSWFEQIRKQANPQDFAWGEFVDYSAIIFVILYLLFLILLFGVRYIRLKKKKRVIVNYLNGPRISVGKGTSLLEASLQAGIPHAHVCGGRGRCSTCRVQVIDGVANISPPGKEELELLKKVNLGRNIRLACKTRAKGACTIHPLLSPTLSSSLQLKAHPERLGVDKEIAILFCDLRDFTAMTEHKLPYDVVFVLNQYYQFMGQAIEANGGKVDKFIGDGIMALFGMESGLEKGCAQALAAAKAMSEQLTRLNDSLKNELEKPLQLGIGIHCGAVIVGEMGYRESTSITAIGDVANTTSRLENACKELDCELVVSEEVARHAHADLSAFPRHQLQVRGRNQSLMVYSLKNVAEWENGLG